MFEIVTNCETCEIDATNTRLSQRGLTSEIYIDETMETVDLEMTVRGDILEKSTFAVFQNNPNPWTTDTKVDISLSKAEVVDVKVYDVNGRLVFSQSIKMSAGLNTVEFDEMTISGSGVFYYEISTSTRSERYKMIKLN